MALRAGLLAVLAAGVAGLALAAPPPERTLLVPSVEDLSADGARAAFGLDLSPNLCAHASLWDVATGRLVRFPLPRRAVCFNDYPSYDAGQTAVAGDRLAWLAHAAIGLNQDFGLTRLFTARVGGRSRPVTTAYWDEGDAKPDDYVGLLAGDGDTLVYHTWTTAPRGALSNERLWRLNAAGRPVALGAAPATTAVATDGGRIAVLTRGGVIRLLNRSGRLLRTLRLSGAATRWPTTKGYDLGFQGRHVAVLAADALEVYDVWNGRRLRSWRHPSSARRERGHVDVHSGVVTYLVRSRVELRRVSDGKTASLRPASELPRGCYVPYVWAQIEETGLFYSLSGICGDEGADRLRFLPFGAVNRRFT